MSSQQLLLDLSVALNSSKKKEKLNGLEKLTELLNQEKVVKSLCKNSEDNSLNWDILFLKVHNAVLSLVDENTAKSRQLCDRHKQIFNNVICQVVQKSLFQKHLLINSNIIAYSVLAVFDSATGIEVLGSAYLHIFNKYVMSEKNWCTLKQEYWVGLKNLCKNHFKNPPQGINGVLFLQMLIDIIRFSSKKCQISHHFLDLFAFLKDIHTFGKKLGSEFENTLLHLTNILCLQLGVEFRYKVCEFMESVFGCVRNCHEQKNPDKNTLVYHFFKTSLNIHNPNGLVDKKSAYACNIGKWKSQIQEIFSLCYEEIKSSLKNSNKMEMELDLLLLFVDVSHLLSEYNFENVPKINIEDDEGATFDEPVSSFSNKRRCSVETVNPTNSRAKQIKLDLSLSNLLSNLSGSDGWFWLKYLELLILKYPDTLKNEYCNVVEFLSKLVCEKKEVENTRGALRCLSRLIDFESSLAKEEMPFDVQVLDDLWNKLSSEVIRSLYTETNVETHLLIRSLISHFKLQDIEPLIRLYCSGTLRPEIENFKTLCTVCQHCILPETLITERGCKNKEENYERVKEVLLSWLLEGEEEFPCSDLAKVLVSLILKKFEDDVVISNPKDGVLISQVNINDFCELITQSYLTVAFKNLKFVGDSKATENSFEKRIEGSMKKKLFDLLEAKCKNLLDALNKEEANRDHRLKALEGCWWFIELMSHILSLFECTTEDCADCTFLTNILKWTLSSCSTASLNLLKVKPFDLSRIGKLYSLSIHHHVQKKIRQPDFINMDLLQLAFELFEEYCLKTQDSMDYLDKTINSDSRFSQLIKNPKSILHFQTLTGREKLMVSIVEMLCQYITIPGSLDSNCYQSVLIVKLMKCLTSDKYFDVNSDFYIQLVLRVVFSFTEYDGIPVSALNDCLDLMQTVLSKKDLDFEVIITALQVLKDLASLIEKAGTEESHLKYKKILEELRNLIVNRKKCGVKAACKFIECLAEIAKVDLEGNWNPTNGSSRCVLEELITFLKHPYHEVRLTAARYVGLLFVHDKISKESTTDWQKRLLNDLFEELKNDLEDLWATEECVLGYHRCVVSSVSLISWASVICLSTYWRKKAFFCLIHLAHLKKFPRSAVEDIVKLISRELNIDEIKYASHNLPYLLHKWVKRGLRIQDFPIFLLGHETISEFLSNHLSVCVTSYAALGHLDDLKALSATVNKPLSRLLKDFHSELLAFILPTLNENVSDGKIKRAQKLKRFIDEQVGSKMSLQWLRENLDEVIFNMIRNMHDPQYLLTLCEFRGNLKDDKSPLGFRSSQITETLENLGKEGKPLLSSVALEVPSVIEKVLRSLLKAVLTAVLYEEKVFAFYKYIFFVELTTESTRSGAVYHDINAFVVRDVAYSLAAILRKNEDDTLIGMACECLRKLGDSYLEDFGSILGEFLPVITTALTPAVKRGNKKALKVLSLFICENYLKLEPHIALLDIFPPEDIFSEINEQIRKTQVHVKNLRNTIKHFIRVGRNKNSGCRTEGLKNLREALSTKKEELREMYGELKMLRGFSEDCKSSLLHQLICMLVDLTSDENAFVRVEAARCLGELGPSDLTTLVLKPENNFTVSKSDIPAMHRLLKTALSILVDLSVSDSYPVKEAASRALYAILSTRQGREIIRGTKESLENAEYLTPFASRSVSNLQMDLKNEIFLRKFARRELWQPCSHEKWIVRLSESLMESLADNGGVVDAFLELIKINWQFAENIFPACLDFVLSFNERNCNEMINANIGAFFEEHFHYRDKSSPTVNKTSVQCILNVIDYVRVQRNQEGSPRGFDLSTNFLNVAKAALYCSAYFTSIFYAELWFEGKRREIQSQKLLYVDINTICELFPEGVALAEILRECHFEIGNLDGIHGCGYMHILNSVSEIQHYEHLENWNLSFLYHDIQLCQGNARSEIGLLQSLERLGMCHTLNRLIKTHSETPEAAAIHYNCAARLLDWSQVDSTYKRKNNFSCDSFEKCFYFALKAVHQEDKATFENESRKARNSVLSELAHCSLESSKNLYLQVTNLQRLKELEEFAALLSGSEIDELPKLFEKWENQDGIRCGDFKLSESILVNRTIMVRDAWEKEKGVEKKKRLGSMLCRLYHKLTVAARKERKYEAAIRTLSYFDSVRDVAEDFEGKMKIEKARILWERGDREIGRFLLNHFLKKNEIQGELKMKSLRIYGEWMAKTKSENTREIIENYYLKSIAESAERHKRIHSYASLAKFAHGVYEQFNEYLSSPLFEIKQNLISTQQDLASELRQELGWHQNRDKRMAYQIAEKQRAIDENEIKNSKAERDSYLALAIEYYLRSLREGEKYNLVVFRLTSLWLSNSTNPDVIRKLQKLLHHIPTYKFLCLLPQLIPRMADVCLISDLIERVLQDHPHHTLPLLLALSNSYEDLKYTGGEATVNNPRVLAASSMIKKFENNKKLERLIREMRRFSDALIELANYSCPERSRPGSPVNFPEHLRVRNIGNLTSVSVPSISIPYNKNCVYDDIVGIREFEPKYLLVGGINLPKRVTCIGSDGVKRALLVKGRDDLRQDAVMQQVFTIMNSLLYENKETSRRKLVIRTYKVVPLSQRSGVIEWCENTQPLSLYLTGPDGKSGAHKTYYPEDASAYDCRCMIRKVFAQPQVSNEEKLRAFLDVCQQLHPVFHNFFIEKFPAAGVWFERRLAYIHSVATSSMIGYILGIGDRHVHNILIDNATAEVIHIDLGVAFEQGRTLPTPETVPFRLTRDIVDGMGLSGVEGDFRISCMRTMEVLRESQDTILTLLEVLLYDPLYAWTITPEKAYCIQNHTETNSTTEKSSTELETNKMAERALIRLKQKLEGTESGLGGTTVEGQVRILINEARDPNNLSRLFHGWQAYL